MVIGKCGNQLSSSNHVPIEFKRAIATQCRISAVTEKMFKTIQETVASV